MFANHKPIRYALWPAAGGAALALAVALALGGMGAPGWWSLAARGAQAQETRPPESPGITVIGDGLVRAQPDTTTIRLGVEVTAQTPAAALSQTREATARVVQRLRERGVPEEDVQTSALNVFPIQAPSREGPPDPAAISGYRGSASVTAQVPDVSRAGELLDAAVQAGATSVQGLSFGLRDDTPRRREAVAAAVRDARPKAEAAAAAAGLTLGGVRSVVELPFGPPRGASGFGGGLGGAGGEGIDPGQLSVLVRAQVTFDVTR